MLQEEKALANIDKKMVEKIPLDLFISQIKNGVELWKQLYSYYTCALMEVETKFKVLNQEFSLQYDRNPIESIKTRIKSPESLAKKMIRKKIPLGLQNVEKEINDVAGIRVICSFIEDIYILADCIKKQDDINLISEKDYIKNPKDNGYRGLHLIVEIPIFLYNEKKYMKVEIQLRTIAMDFWASLEHKLYYKKDVSDSISSEIKTELLECANVASRLDIKMQEIRNKLDKY